MAVLDRTELQALDHRFDDRSIGRALPALRRPVNGWVKAVRRALGMSARQLGDRLGVSASAVSQLERSEVDGGISLKKLAALADALDCELVYALVPRTTLADTVRARARERAHVAAALTNRHMALEDQRVPRRDLEWVEERLAVKFAGRRDLWDRIPGDPSPRVPHP